MALTAYCKKCKQEVPPGEVCPRCGTRLGKTAIHVAWVTRRRPVADWMCWNAVMRLLLPAGLAVLVLVLVLEFFSGGFGALERLFLSGFPLTLGLLLFSVLLVVFLALLLQGPELIDYVIDSRGIHATRYLPDPTPLKLLCRLKPPARMNALDPATPSSVLALGSRDLAWKDVARVQLWPEKCYVLFYAPAGWLRIPVQCTPFTWEDVLTFIREKLGKKKKVHLPDSLRASAPARPAAVRRPLSTEPPAPVSDPGEAASPRSAGIANRPSRTPDSENEEQQSLFDMPETAQGDNLSSQPDDALFPPESMDQEAVNANR